MSRWKDLWITPPIRNSLQVAPPSMRFELKCWFSHWGGAFFCECCSLQNPTKGMSFPGQTGCLIQWADKLNLSFFMEDGLSCAGSSYKFLQETKANYVFTYLPQCTFFCISLRGLGSLEIGVKVFTFQKRYLCSTPCQQVHTHICLPHPYELSEHSRCEVRLQI